MARAASRRLLDLDDDEFVMLLFGNIRPYKGIDRFLQSIGELYRRTTPRPVRALVAGPAFNSDETSQFMLRAKSTPGVSVVASVVHPSHLQVLFRAADLVVLPYTDFLNSGVLMLALTFGTPVLVAENGVTRDAVSSGLVRLFAQGSDEALAEELERAVAEPDRLRAGPLSAEFARR